MSHCCQSKPKHENHSLEQAPGRLLCPNCQGKGKAVAVVTLKCLLTAEAMTRLKPESSYQFCPNPACPTVYFSPEHHFMLEALQVPVFQKSLALETPVCYCFGFTRGDLHAAQEQKRTEEIAQVVKNFVKAGQCACEFRNPQGSCCLGNIGKFSL